MDLARSRHCLRQWAADLIASRIPPGQGQESIRLWGELVDGLVGGWVDGVLGGVFAGARGGKRGDRGARKSNNFGKRAQKGAKRSQKLRPKGTKERKVYKRGPKGDQTATRNRKVRCPSRPLGAKRAKRGAKKGAKMETKRDQESKSRFFKNHCFG